MSTQDPTPPSDRPPGEPPEAPRFGQSSEPSGQVSPAEAQYGQADYGQGQSGQGQYGQAQAGQGQYGQPAAPYAGGASPYGGGYGGQGEQPRNGMGVAALVVGIVALLFSWFPGAGLLGVVAIILGIVGLSRVRKRLATNRGTSIAGIVLGAVATVVGILILILTVFVFQQAGTAVQECSQLEPGSVEQQQCIEDNLLQQ